MARRVQAPVSIVRRHRTWLTQPTTLPNSSAAELRRVSPPTCPCAPWRARARDASELVFGTGRPRAAPTGLEPGAGELHVGGAPGLAELGFGGGGAGVVLRAQCLPQTVQGPAVVGIALEILAEHDRGGIGLRALS